MNKSIYIIFGMLMVVPSVWSNDVTPSVQCPGESFDDLRERIQVIPCGKTRCKLLKNTNTTVIFKFKPDKEIQTLISNVSANFNGVDLPFIGVHGVNACPHVKRADTGVSAPCPLAPGVEYIFTNVFPILPIYPDIILHVHWSLDDGDRKVICFEVPAIITSGSKNKN